MYEIILDSEVDPGSPITHSLIRRLRDNPYSLVSSVAVDGGVSIDVPVTAVAAPSGEWPTDLGSAPYHFTNTIDEYNTPSASAQYVVAARSLYSMACAMLVGASDNLGRADTWPIYLRVEYTDGVPVGLYVKMLPGFFLSGGFTRSDPNTERTWFPSWAGSILVGGETFIPVGGGMTTILTATRSGMTIQIRLGCLVTSKAIRLVVDSVKSSDLVGGTVGGYYPNNVAPADLTRVMFGVQQ